MLSMENGLVMPGSRNTSRHPERWTVRGGFAWLSDRIVKAGLGGVYFPQCIAIDI